MLQTTGVLYEKPFGPAVAVKEDDVGQVVVAVDSPDPNIAPPPPSEAFRRSIYIQVRRTQPLASCNRSTHRDGNELRQTTGLDGTDPSL